MEDRHNKEMMPGSAKTRMLPFSPRALALTEELDDLITGLLIERALDEARAQQFRPPIAE